MARQPGLFPAPTPAQLAPYGQPVFAYRTTSGFDAVLGYIMRGVCTVEFHLERGQVGHHGAPHAFVPAGEVTVMGPRDGTVNLDPAVAAALRRRG